MHSAVSVISMSGRTEQSSMRGIISSMGDLQSPEAHCSADAHHLWQSGKLKQLRWCFCSSFHAFLHALPLQRTPCPIALGANVIRVAVGICHGPYLWLRVLHSEGNLKLEHA